MKAKIIKCNDPMMWYSDKVGEQINLIAESSEYYWAREDAGYSNIVHKEDVELL